jgi:hypothetical protein
VTYGRLNTPFGSVLIQFKNGDGGCSLPCSAVLLRGACTPAAHPSSIGTPSPHRPVRTWQVAGRAAVGARHQCPCQPSKLARPPVRWPHAGGVSRATASTQPQRSLIVAPASPRRSMRAAPAWGCLSHPGEPHLTSGHARTPRTRCAAQHGPAAMRSAPRLPCCSCRGLLSRVWLAATSLQCS